MQKKLPESPFIFNFIVYYFIIFLIILFSFIYFVKIDHNMTVSGKIKNYLNYNKEYSDYEGVVTKIHVKKGDKVKEGDKLYEIKIFDPNKAEKELKIKVLENDLLFLDKEIEKEKIKNEIKILKEEELIKTIYSKNKGKIDILNIKKNNIINKKQVTLEINPEEESNILYIESELDVNNSNNIKLNQPIIFYLKTNNSNLIKYKGIIFDIHKEVYTDKNNKNFLKFDSIILENLPFEIKEGLEVEVIIKINEKRLIDFIF